jgi:hypothetical protein
MDDTPTDSLRNRLSPRLVVGLAIMTLGGLLTLENLGVFNIVGLWRWWPLVLVLVGLSKFVQGADVFGALVWSAAGGAVLAANFGLLQIKQLWPLVLLVVGARLIFGALGKEGTAESCATDGMFRVSRPPADAADRIDAFAMLGGTVRGTNSQNFRRGAATAVMGGCEIDLRRAKIAGTEAVFDAFAMWGGVEIKVPEDWAVENRGMGLLGGFVDSTRRPAEAKGRLILSGLAIMGGVEAKN